MAKKNFLEPRPVWPDGVRTHELARLFPGLTADEYLALKVDIAEHGVQVPVLFTEDGRLLDGKHRVKAWSEIKADLDHANDQLRKQKKKLLPALADYPYEVVPAGQEVSRAVSANLYRRHLNESQRAMVAAKLSAASLRGGDRRSDQSRNNDNVTQSEAAERMGVSRDMVIKARKVNEEAPLLAAAVLDGEVAVSDARSAVEASESVQKAALDEVRTGQQKNLRKAIQAHQRASKAEELMAAADDIAESDYWSVEHCAIADWKLDDQVDYIITDPPYPAEFLNCWSELGAFASKNLKEGGLLVAMSGTVHLLNVLYRLDQFNLNFEWLLSFETKHGAKNQQRRHARTVSSSWKPIIVFSKGQRPDGRKPFLPDIISHDEGVRDVGEVHKWQQSEAGMKALIEAVIPEDEQVWSVTVADPFCGAGTTGVAANWFGVRFLGADADEEAVKISRGRLTALETTE